MPAAAVWDLLRPRHRDIDRQNPADRPGHRHPSLRRAPLAGLLQRQSRRENQGIRRLQPTPSVSFACVLLSEACEFRADSIKGGRKTLSAIGVNVYRCEVPSGPSARLEEKVPLITVASSSRMSSRRNLETMRSIISFT